MAEVATALRGLFLLGTRAGHKVRYGTLLVDALGLDRAPRALDFVLARARR